MATQSVQDLEKSRQKACQELLLAREAIECRHLTGPLCVGQKVDAMHRTELLLPQHELKGRAWVWISVPAMLLLREIFIENNSLLHFLHSVICEKSVFNKFQSACDNYTWIQ